MRRCLVVSILMSVALLASGCGGDDGGDLEGYCALVRDGVGVDSEGAVVDAREYETLLDIAPDEIHETVQQLANASRGLSEITELDQLFDAAFDPEAQAARGRFSTFAIEECGLDADALPEGRVESPEQLLEDLSAYIDENFGNETWTPKVRYRIERENGALEGVTVSFVIDAVSDEAVSACNALRPYLYDIRQAEGVIEVVDGRLVLARSDGPGPDNACVAL